MSTARDVARLARVSPITVSRVINNSGHVSKTTRERVEEAILKLGYVPNSLARSLRSRKTSTLALIVTDITNPFWTTVSRGVEDAASKAGYNVIFCNTDESEAKQDKYLRLVLEKRVDGILLVPARSTMRPVWLIQKQNIPIVLLDRRIPDGQVDVVRCDSERGAYELVRLLVSLEHRKITVLSGPKGVSTAEDRVAGYLQALLEQGISPRTKLMQYGEFSQTSGYKRTKKISESTPRATAIFAANNFIAIGVLKALRDSGLRVPEDMALVAFDDLPKALVIDPFLTVAAQPAYDMGQRAAELLLSRLRGQTPKEFQELILPPEIIVRRSSGGRLVKKSYDEEKKNEQR